MTDLLTSINLLSYGNCIMLHNMLVDNYKRKIRLIHICASVSVHDENLDSNLGSVIEALNLNSAASASLCV